MIYPVVLLLEQSSGYFSITRGVRQGDLISPYLYILSLEALAQMIIYENPIKGLNLQIGVVSLLLYADVESAKPFFTIANFFGQNSGLVLNMSKTESLWIGGEGGGIQAVN